MTPNTGWFYFLNDAVYKNCISFWDLSPPGPLARPLWKILGSALDPHLRPHSVLRTLAYLNQNQFIAVASKYGVVNHSLNVKAAIWRSVIPCFKFKLIVLLSCLFFVFLVFIVYIAFIVCVYSMCFCAAYMA